MKTESIRTKVFYRKRKCRNYDVMGSHIVRENGKTGVRFTVWAPSALQVKIVGNFNNWKSDSKFSLTKGDNGIWSRFIPGIKEKCLYKYEIIDVSGNKVLKSDPYSRYSEKRPGNASVITGNRIFNWSDSRWMSHRRRKNIFESPVNIYEIHLGSWRKKANGEFFTYKETARELGKYLKTMNYNYVEIMPLMEHPLDDSWGYQVTGYYSVSSRYGDIQDFKCFVNIMHKFNIGVILDWVPGHFCKDSHGLYKFDGTSTYEYKDKNQCENKSWGTGNFDLGKKEVKEFLINNAIFWIKEFHVDGLRVDAVANTLYLDYDKCPGQWTPNKKGGNENLEAVKFYRELNEILFSRFHNIFMIAEESTTWPLVTAPSYKGGLGFNFKWNMGWMNDVLKYVGMSPDMKKRNHKLINFSMMYNYSENFILPISHDEVVHGKKSLIDKMYGDYWNKFAGLRVFMTYMYTHPGKKLVFMGTEFAQFSEWDNSKELQWDLINKFSNHKKTKEFFRSLNEFYMQRISLWKFDYDTRGFEWIDADNSGQSILIYARKAVEKEDTLIVVCNFSPKVYYDYNIGVPYLGEYREVFNTDHKKWGGSGEDMRGVILYSKEKKYHNQKFCLTIKVPPMAATIIEPVKLYNKACND